MLTIKSLHIIFMVAWYAGLFYLPRLFVYHAMATDAAVKAQLQVMERRLYRGIMMPSMVLTLVFGVTLWLHYGIGGHWLYAKLGLVVLLVMHHFWLGKLMCDFAENKNQHSHVFYRWINEIPALPILIGVVFLVVFKPF